MLMRNFKEIEMCLQNRGYSLKKKKRQSKKCVILLELTEVLLPRDYQHLLALIFAFVALMRAFLLLPRSAGLPAPLPACTVWANR